MDSYTLQEALNSSVIEQFRELQLRDVDGHIKYARTMNIVSLSHHCDVELVAEFAHLTLRLIHSESMMNKTLMNGEEEYSLIPYWVKLILSFIFIVVGCIGLVGNLLTVLVICKTKSLHSHTNYFLASLATSDLCLIVVGVPFDLFHLWRKNQPPTIAGYCEFMSTSISLFTFASILTIVSLTAERFVAICYPFSLRALFEKRRVINLIYAIWIVAFFPSLYIGLQFKQVTEDFCGYNRELGPGIGSCDYVTSQAMPFRYPFEVTMLLTFILPLVLIVYCYMRILHTLNEMAAQTTVHLPVHTMNSDSSQVGAPSILYVHTKNCGPQKSQQAQKMVIKMLVTVTIVFFMCYLPYHIERLIAQYTKPLCNKSLLCLLLYPVTGLLQYVSATLNPIFYNMMSLRFRNAFKTMFQDIVRRHKEYSSIVRL